jgi:hypothetical protein
MTIHHNKENQVFPKEITPILAKIFNLSEDEIVKHSHLFLRINPYVKNCLNYLSKIEDDNMRISAAYSLDYLLHFKESVF